MYIFQLLVVLGASVLALGVPTGNIEQSGLASGDLDKRFYYNSYIDKRDTNENNGVDNTSTTTTTRDAHQDSDVDKRFYYNKYVGKRDAKEDSGVGKRFVYDKLP
ncbi:hypothetical protein BDV29DRAFT_153589 [Aspergillus leporis]|uniref:Uncharacterized protein n=1 Tax=Aspergillus leporis TaxID=41062 RepID=A0A5N5XA66_9EURO|nr:hypothetical protein BDV29DRAFT_153589 [Aspergillus leporis]